MTDRKKGNRRNDLKDSKNVLPCVILATGQSKGNDRKYCHHESGDDI